MRIAIIGGIGSGKSEVTKILEELGKNVVRADDINARLLRDAGYIKKLKELFPLYVSADGDVDKRAIAEAIYTDRYTRDKLNALAHPLIMDRILAKTGVGTWFAEIPLMKESYVEYFDRIWYVKSTDEQRIARVVKRDNMSVAAAMRIMRAQTEYSGIEEYATDIIINDGSVSGLRQSVKDLCRGLDEK